MYTYIFYLIQLIKVSHFIKARSYANTITENNIVTYGVCATNECLEIK